MSETNTKNQSRQIQRLFDGSEPQESTDTGIIWKANTVIVDGTKLTVMFPEEKAD